MALLTLGCDPELVPIRKRKWLPAWELTKGTKQRPEFVHHPDNNIGLKVQADGTTLEFNIHHIDINAASHCGLFLQTINLAKEILYQTYGIDLHVSPVLQQSNYTSYPDLFRHELCQISGCDPDFDAYGEAPVRQPLDLSLSDTRYSGGHIHVGYDTKMCPPEVFAKFMDLFVGLEHRDPQGSRRQFYGKAGIYRPKEYGIEYRTPSPNWVLDAVMTLSYARGAYVLVHALTNYPKEMRELYKETLWPAVKLSIEAEHGDRRRNQLALRNTYMARNCPGSYELSIAYERELANNELRPGRIFQVGEPDELGPLFDDDDNAPPDIDETQEPEDGDEDAGQER
jgi:hypothetical protein